MPGQRRIDRVLDGGYLDDLERRSTVEIRAMRSECEEEESGISFARRVLQGKLDIVRAEAVRRQAAGSEVAASVVDSLPSILADRTTAGPAPRAPRLRVPPEVGEGRRELDQLTGQSVLLRLRERDDEDLRALAAQMASKERELSDIRRALLDRIDEIQAEFTRRYKSGAADISELLTPRS